MSLEYTTLPSIWRRYDTMPRQLAFRARTLEEWAAWHDELRRRLVLLLGGFPTEHPPLTPVILEREDTEHYWLEKVAFQSEPDVVDPLLMCSFRSGRSHPIGR